MNCVLGNTLIKSLNGNIEVMCKVDFAKPAILVVAFLAIAGSAFAQPLAGRSNYDIKNMSFDAWCQETRQYPTDRCDARRPEDCQSIRGLPRRDRTLRARLSEAGFSRMRNLRQISAAI